MFIARLVVVDCSSVHLLTTLLLLITLNCSIYTEYLNLSMRLKNKSCFLTFLTLDLWLLNGLSLLKRK
jgi:hypothetical protein